MSRAFRFTLNAALFWIAISTFWYSCVIKDVCLPDPPKDGVQWPLQLPSVPSPTAAAPRAAPAAAQTSKPLTFSWNGADPVRGSGFEKFRSDVLRQQTGDATLEITGIHFAGERSGDLAMDRARRVQELFADLVPADRIKLAVRVAAPASSEQRTQFEAVAIRWIKPGEERAVPPPLSSSTTPPPVAGAQASIAGSRILVYFPTGAGTQTLDPETLTQLRTLATEAARTGLTIVITGHTDSRGDEAGNVALGLTRATTIRDYLAATVSPAPQMRVESEGPRQPIASNDTEEGRARNRRVEVAAQ